MSDTAPAMPQGTDLSATGAPAGAPNPTPAPVQMTSDVLAARLAEERTKGENRAVERLLKDLGVEKIDDAKAALKAAKAADEAKKTETEKLLGRITELEPAAKRAADLEAVVKAQADAALASLTDIQRAAVTALGGEDPAQQLRAIAALRPTWAVAPQGAPPPANNAPPANQPKPAASKTKFDEWSDIKNDPRRQVSADLFYNANRFEIERTRPA